MFIGGVSRKTLQTIFTDAVKKSFSAELKKNKKIENGTKIDDTADDRNSILNIQELQDMIFSYMEKNQQLQMAHAAEMGGNRNIAVPKRIEFTER